MIRIRFRQCLALLRNILCVFAFILVLTVYRMYKFHDDQIKSKLSKNAIKFIDFEEKNYENELSRDTLKKLIAECNQEARILNLDIYGSLKPDAPVFVISVDKFRANLKYFLASLHHVHEIQNALVIFSHSYYDENVNRLIKTIDFARVVQIFYPYSLQVYNNEFPGYQSGDCPSDMKMDSAVSINCTGAIFPDIHGRYRNPWQAQKKHFWWWTANYVFEKLCHTKKHEGIFIFLEDDVFLMEDFIYMTLQMKNISKFIFQCDFVALDTLEEPDFFEKKTHGAGIRTWDPKQHYRVLAFDAQVWNIIAAHYYLFCAIDDYSWAHSLFYLSLNRKDGNRFKVITSILPRAFKTSKPNVHEYFSKLYMLDTVFGVLEMGKRNKGKLFPAQLEVHLDIELEYDEFVIFDILESNGGWSDPRDKQMCRNITQTKIRKILMEMNNEFNNYSHDEAFEIEDDTL